MKVTLKKIISKHHLGWLVPEKVYDVISLEIEIGNCINLRLVTENNAIPAMFPIKDFDIIDDTPPSNWKIKKFKNGLIEFAPKAWLEDGFWELFFDLDTCAQGLYYSELEKIIEASNVADVG